MAGASTPQRDYHQGPWSEPVAASVVIVNYQGRGRLGRCLDAVLASPSRCTSEIIVVDNASADGSWDEAESRPGVRLVRNDENVGFGRACNQAAALARGRHLVFLNYDCEPEPGWLDALVRCADDDPGVGAAQAVVLHPDGTVNTAGNRLHYLGFSWAPNGGVAPTGPPAEIAVGSGACLLVPAHRFREVGGFWEAMFLYCEDTDLCWRLRLAGPAHRRLPGCPRPARLRVRPQHLQALPPGAQPPADAGRQLRALDARPAGTCVTRHRARSPRRRGPRRLAATEAACALLRFASAAGST